MHPSEPASGSQPGPADPMQSLVAHLDDVMAQAEIAANAERDLEAGTPTAPSARQEARAPDDEGEAEDESDESAPGEEPQDEEDEDESEGEEGSEGEEPTPATAEHLKYSRRDAARFAGELESTKQELEKAKAQINSHLGELANFKQSDQIIRQHLAEQSGYVRESNGRFRYENLSEKVLKGTATVTEQDEVARMTQWHEFAAPIFRAAEEMVLGSFSVDWGSLKDLDGVGDEGLKKLNAAPTSIAATKALHSMAYAAGLSKAKVEAAATIASLKAQVKSLKTGRLAASPQPASTNGAAVPSKGGFLQRAIDSKTGLPNPDFDREVQAGKWLGVDLAQS